jgi:hypothetical protein
LLFNVWVDDIGTRVLDGLLCDVAELLLLVIDLALLVLILSSSGHREEVVAVVN